jgi:DNA-binding IclR family transcriptional regulator
VVSLLANHPSETFPVAEIARRLGYNRATCHAVLLALEEAGWVRRSRERGYAVGPGLIPLGSAALAGVPVVEVLRRAVQELHGALGLEVLGCVPAGPEIVVVARAGPTDPFSMAMRVGQSFPLAPPFGLTFVAWNRPEVDHWAARTPDLTARERARMHDAAALVRQVGYCVTLDPATRQSLGETVARLARDPQSSEARSRQTELVRALAHDEYVTVDAEQHRTMRVSQVSAPVFGPEEDVVAVMGIVIAPGQVQSSDVPALGERVRAATDRLTRDLSGRRPPVDPDGPVPLHGSNATAQGSPSWSR